MRTGTTASRSTSRPASGTASQRTGAATSCPFGLSSTAWTPKRHTSRFWKNTVFPPRHRNPLKRKRPQSSKVSALRSTPLQSTFQKNGWPKPAASKLGKTETMAPNGCTFPTTTQPGRNPPTASGTPTRTSAGALAAPARFASTVNGASQSLQTPGMQSWSRVRATHRACGTWASRLSACRGLQCSSRNSPRCFRA